MSTDRHRERELAAEAAVAAGEQRDIQSLLIGLQRRGSMINVRICPEIVRMYYGDSPPAHARAAVIDAIIESQLA